ncbi:hypothetical protein QJQ45_026449 [Haematococcus lacustris]|nr:hypothetical protein QJQ45_026449 [Haematococcus lacustris]
MGYDDEDWDDEAFAAIDNLVSKHKQARSSGASARQLPQPAQEPTAAPVLLGAEPRAPDKAAHPLPNAVMHHQPQPQALGHAMPGQPLPGAGPGPGNSFERFNCRHALPAPAWQQQQQQQQQQVPVPQHHPGTACQRSLPTQAETASLTAAAVLGSSRGPAARHNPRAGWACVGHAILAPPQAAPTPGLGAGSHGSGPSSGGGGLGGTSARPAWLPLPAGPRSGGGLAAAASRPLPAPALATESGAVGTHAPAAAAAAGGVGHKGRDHVAPQGVMGAGPGPPPPAHQQAGSGVQPQAPGRLPWAMNHASTHGHASSGGAGSTSDGVKSVTSCPHQPTPTATNIVATGAAAAAIAAAAAARPGICPSVGATPPAAVITSAVAASRACPPDAVAPSTAAPGQPLSGPRPSCTAAATSTAALTSSTFYGPAAGQPAAPSGARDRPGPDSNSPLDQAPGGGQQQARQGQGQGRSPGQRQPRQACSPLLPLPLAWPAGGEGLQGPGFKAGPAHPLACSISLESASHLGFTFPGPHNDVTQVMRDTAGCSFDAGRKCWLVPMKLHQVVKDKLGRLGSVKVAWERDLPDLVQAVHRAALARPDDAARYSRVQQLVNDMGQSLEQQMHAFQREGVKWALAHGGRVLIGDEMGLGKTVQGCALMKCYEDEWPALVVTPSSLRQQWADALKKWIGVLDIDIHTVFSKTDQQMVLDARKSRLVDKHIRLPFRILVISYDYLDRAQEELQGLGFQVVVLDEAHYIKNHQASQGRAALEAAEGAKRTKAALPLLQKAQRAVLLSGTPALSRPHELMTLMQAVLPAAKIKHSDFMERYCRLDNWRKVVGSKNTDELNKLITGTFMIRRLKKDVLTQLPPKIRQQVYLRVDDKAAVQLKRQQGQLAEIKELMSCGGGMAGSLNALHQEQRQAVMGLYHETARLKVPAVQGYIKDLLENDVKMLVFGHHMVLLDGVEKAVNDCKTKYIRIDGKTSAKSRDGMRAQFQEDPDTKVAILGIQAAGVGLTLTAASTVLFAELSWVPGEIMQAEDRAHRIGQESSVNIHFLLVSNSIDDIMWDTIQSKLNNVGRVLDGKTDSLQVASKTEAVRTSGTLDAYLQPATSPKRSSGAGGASGRAAAAGTDEAYGPPSKRSRGSGGPVSGAASAAPLPQAKATDGQDSDDDGHVVVVGTKRARRRAME